MRRLVSGVRNAGRRWVTNVPAVSTVRFLARSAPAEAAADEPVATTLDTAGAFPATLAKGLTRRKPATAPLSPAHARALARLDALRSPSASAEPPAKPPVVPRGRKPVKLPHLPATCPKLIKNVPAAAPTRRRRRSADGTASADPATLATDEPPPPAKRKRAKAAGATAARSARTVTAKAAAPPEGRTVRATRAARAKKAPAVRRGSKGARAAGKQSPAVPLHRSVRARRALIDSYIQEYVAAHPNASDAAAARHARYEGAVLTRKVRRRLLPARKKLYFPPAPPVAPGGHVLFDRVGEGLPSGESPDLLPEPLRRPGVLKPHQVEAVRFMWRACFPSPPDADPDAPPTPAPAVDAVDGDGVEEGEGPAPRRARVRSTVPTGCVVAHAMGLGKTVAVAAFLAACAHHRAVCRVLIVAPSQVVGHWTYELRKWVDFALGVEGASDPYVHRLPSSGHFEARMRNVEPWLKTGGLMVTSHYGLMQPIRDAALQKKLRAEEAKGLGGDGVEDSGDHLHGKLALVGQPGKLALVGQPGKLAVVGEGRKERALSNAAKKRHAAVTAVFARRSEEERRCVDAVRDAVQTAAEMVVIDEAHTLNNPNLLYHAAGSVRTMRRIALTGTPLQNTVKDIMRLVNWARPFYFSRYAFDHFKPLTRIHVPAAERKAQASLFALLREELEGVMHRCDHTPLREVLPPMTEVSVVLRPTALQRELNNEFMGHIRKLFGKVVHKHGRSMTAADAGFLTAVRQATNITTMPAAVLRAAAFMKQTEVKRKMRHQVKGPYDISSYIPLGNYAWARSTHDVWALSAAPPTSPKTELAVRMVREFARRGERTLVFSQCIEAVEEVARLVREAGCTADVVHGFQEGKDAVLAKWANASQAATHIAAPAGAGEAPPAEAVKASELADVLCITVKTGGVGLTLVAASRVILLDQWFNPMVELQAMMRVYRYGQALPVFVYQLLVQNLADERLYRRRLQKTDLADRLLDDVKLSSQGFHYRAVLAGASVNAADESAATQAAAKELASAFARADAAAGAEGVGAENVRSSKEEQGSGGASSAGGTEERAGEAVVGPGVVMRGEDAGYRAALADAAEVEGRGSTRIGWDGSLAVATTAAPGVVHRSTAVEAAADLASATSRDIEATMTSLGQQRHLLRQQGGVAAKVWGDSLQPLPDEKADLFRADSALRAAVECGLQGCTAKWVEEERPQCAVAFEEATGPAPSAGRVHVCAPGGEPACVIAKVYRRDSLLLFEDSLNPDPYQLAAARQRYDKLREKRGFTPVEFSPDRRGGVSLHGGGRRGAPLRVDAYAVTEGISLRARREYRASRGAVHAHSDLEPANKWCTWFLNDDHLPPGHDAAGEGRVESGGGGEAGGSASQDAEVGRVQETQEAAKREASAGN